MKKIFISQPMRGLTDEEILNKRKNIISEIQYLVKEECEIIDSFLKGFEPIGNIPVAYLGKSIKLLSEADIAYFGEGWESARGCKIEHEVAKQYGIKIIEYNQI